MHAHPKPQSPRKRFCRPITSWGVSEQWTSVLGFNQNSCFRNPMTFIAGPCWEFFLNDDYVPGSQIIISLQNSKTRSLNFRLLSQRTNKLHLCVMALKLHMRMGQHPCVYIQHSSCVALFHLVCPYVKDVSIKNNETTFCKSLTPESYPPALCTWECVSQSWLYY